MLCLQKCLGLAPETAAAYLRRCGTGVAAGRADGRRRGRSGRGRARAARARPSRPRTCCSASRPTWLWAPSNPASWWLALDPPVMWFLAGEWIKLSQSYKSKRKGKQTLSLISNTIGRHCLCNNNKQYTKK